MNPPNTSTALALALGLGLVAIATGADDASWPQFRGPDGLGTAAATANPPVRFGPDSNVAWSVALPPGLSSPCVVADRILLTGVEGDALATLCLRRSDGAVLWRRSVEAPRLEETHRLASPATPTPVSDGSRVVSYFGSFGLVAYDLEGGELWRQALEAPVVEFGTASSPVMSRGRVFVVRDQDSGSHLLALDAATGRILWRVERPEFRRSFATPFLWRHDGTEELVVPGSIWLKSYDPADGRELWTYSGTSRVACSTPVAGDGLLFSASWNVGGDPDSRIRMEPWEEFVATIGKPVDAPVTAAAMPAGPVRDRFTQIDLDKDGRVTKAEWENMRAMFAKAGNAVLAIRPGGKGDVTSTHLAWKSVRSLPYVASPLYLDGRLYTVKNGGLASCYRASTGEPLYQDHRLDAPGDYYASPVAAGGRLYWISERGTVVVTAAGDRPEVLARNELGEAVRSSPAVVGDTLYVRTATRLFAFRDGATR